jgi:hypothetical protein
MAQIPAFCSACGASFGSGIDVGDQVRNLTLTGNKSRCPVCGGWGEKQVSGFLSRFARAVAAREAFVLAPYFDGYFGWCARFQC